MLPFFNLFRRQDPDTLIWEYLDGEITPSRAQRLSTLLKRRPKMRKRLVEFAVLHGMLIEYFRGGQAQSEGDGIQRVERARRGRFSAA